MFVAPAVINTVAVERELVKYVAMQ